MMRSVLLTFLIAIGAASAPTASNGHARTTAATQPPISFTLRAIRDRVFVGGAPARVRIEMQNNGTADFIIGEDFLPITNASTYVLLDLTDSHGQSEPAAGITVYAPFPAQNASWTRIAAGHFYGLELDLDPEDYPALSRPGRYKVTATYVSKGGNTPASPDWQVPSHKVWEGKIVSNSIWIEVLPNANSK